MESGNNSVVRALDSWSKGYGSNPCRGGGTMFFTRVNFLCWLFFQYLFHPRVTAVACKRPSQSAKSACGRLQLNTHAPYACGFAWSDMVHGCLVYTEHAEMATVSCGTSHASTVSTPLWWIFKNMLFTHVDSHASAVGLLKSANYIKAINNNSRHHRCCSCVNTPWQALGQGGGALWLVDYHRTDCQFLPRPISRNNNQSV